MDKCYGNNKKVKEVEAEATAKAAAVNKNWNIQYVTVINDSLGVEEEKYRKIAGDPEKIDELASKLKDKYDGENETEAEAEAESKAIIRNNNVNLVFVDTGDVDLDIG